MYLAMEVVTPNYPSGRAFHAARAIECWEAVVNRTGVSRLPIDQAKEGLETARQLFGSASKAVEEQEDEEDDLPLDPRLKEQS